MSEVLYTQDSMHLSNSQSQILSPRRNGEDAMTVVTKMATPSSGSRNGQRYGSLTKVTSTGDFPTIGSSIGSLFCLEEMGRGTFSSIHKCIEMDYPSGRPRLAAAKVEVTEFLNSGVLDAEAAILDYLSSNTPKGTVPEYMGYFGKGNEGAALVMEFLPGSDLAQIRDKLTNKSRRLSVKDAVYLTADVMLPRLRRMHEAGIVHRDVKPSNIVNRSGKEFLLIDFGLSKSIIVGGNDPSQSDLSHPWEGKSWLFASDKSSKGYYRKEREKAEFRGSSMYASLRVHQLKDYCPRDDVWGLMYVFCDLLTGGLPWMQHAGIQRDRDACQQLKETIHGEKDGKASQLHRLLMGRDHHIAVFNKYDGKETPPLDEMLQAEGLPAPLAMSTNPRLVQHLQKAFDHLGSLNFWDAPDYDLITSCFMAFLEEEVDDDTVSLIQWDLLESRHTRKHKLGADSLMLADVPTWEMEDSSSSVDDTFLARAIATVEKQLAKSGDSAGLPLKLRFQIAQMEYNVHRHERIPLHLALRDWLQVAMPLHHIDWDNTRFEKGGSHRAIDDGYRRETLVALIDKSLSCASRFGWFGDNICVYEDQGDSQPRKKRKVTIVTPDDTETGEEDRDLLFLSDVFARLRMTRRTELSKSRAPPPRLSFG